MSKMDVIPPARSGSKAGYHRSASGSAALWNEQKVNIAILREISPWHTEIDSFGAKRHVPKNKWGDF